MPVKMGPSELKRALKKIFPGRLFSDNGTLKILASIPQYVGAVAETLKMMDCIPKNPELWREESYLFDYLQKTRREFAIAKYNNLFWKTF